MVVVLPKDTGVLLSEEVKGLCTNTVCPFTLNG